MMNDFENIPAESEFRNEMTVSPEEQEEQFFTALDEADYYAEFETPNGDEPEPYDGYEGCWPGDGSGMDDLADFNANEAMDYCDE